VTFPAHGSFNIYVQKHCRILCKTPRILFAAESRQFTGQNARLLMMKTSILLALITALGPVLFAQHAYTVIATAGLKLRATPDQRGKTLAVAPFGAQVAVYNVLSRENEENVYKPKARRDTLGTLMQYTFWNGEAPETRTDVHIGYWWTVRYKGKKGYMFSGFLAGKEELGEGTYTNLNDQWRLQMPGGATCTSFRPDLKKQWNWYGLFRQPDGKFALRAIQLNYKIADYTEENGDYGLLQRELIVQAADVPEQPIFLIGKKGAWTECKDISGVEAYPVLGQLSVFMNPDTGWNINLLQTWGVLVGKVPDGYDGEYAMSLENAQKAPQQLILHHPGRDYKQAPGDLLWAGDLDGDGRRDYLFDAAGEIGANMLYLSSQAKPGEVAGLVALMWHWYCC